MRYRIEQKIETLASDTPPAGQRPRADLNPMRSARGLTTWEGGPDADLTQDSRRHTGWSSTVHWVCQEDPEAASDREVAVSRVQEWSARKRLRFQDRHIRKAWLRLWDQGWLGDEPAIGSAARHAR
jgi:hypothetical protein